MRTKTLLMAAAALAAGIITSQAQPVYSANVVGYASVPFSANYTMLETPFNIGSSNGANEVYGANLQDGMVFVTWNGAGFDQTLYSPSFNSIFSVGSDWMDPGSFTALPVPTIPPGQGYFLYSPGAGTNVAAGTVAINVGATNNMDLPANYSLVGSVLPLSGSVTNAAFNAPLQDGTVFVIWNGSGYDQTLYSPSFNSIFSVGSDWMDPGTFAALPPPSVAVGQGFFIYEPGSQTWSQTLQAN